MEQQVAGMTVKNPIANPRAASSVSDCKAVFFAALLLAGGAQLLAQDAPGFRAELRSITESTEANWSVAEEQLTALLAKHKDADYVRHARTEIVDLHRRLAFEASYTQPDPDDLISGDLVSYKAKTGKIKLVYTRKTLADFSDPNQPKPVVKPKYRPGQLPRFEMPAVRRRGPEYRPRIHPAQFKSCKIEVTGKSYDGTELLTGINHAGLFRINAGRPFVMPYGSSRFSPTLIIRRTGEQDVDLFRTAWLPKKSSTGKKRKSLWPVELGRKYTVLLEVMPKSLHLRINRKSVVKESWRGAVAGRIGIVDSSFDKLTLTGKVEPAWIHGLLDDHRQVAHKKFIAGYKSNAQLPAWMFTAPKVVVDSSGSKSQRYYPGTERPKDLELVKGVLADLNKGRSTRVLFRMALWKPEQVPALVKQFLMSYAYFVGGNFKKSIDLGEQVVAADPNFCNGHVVLGRSYLALRQMEAAEQQFREVLKLQPNLANAHRELALALVGQSKPKDARRVLGDATSRGWGNDLLHAMRRRVDRIIDGPTFGKRFTVETKHYVITSDIDEAVCKSAGKVLEGALAYYCNMLGNVRNKFENGQRFKVYLFSGEQGYKRYLEGLELRIPIHTAGVYSPELQQLLIWNLSNRTDMLRTIRHEGFHQYFDMLAADTPVWLNEGLAEYFEVSRFNVGKPSAGVLRPRHVRTLALVRSNARDPLDDFMQTTPRQFYGPKASLNYSKSWALVRYLRGGTPKVRAVFDRLVRALSKGKSRDEALAEALEGVDMERLTKGYWASIDKLLAKK
ncbi:MAG: tetratricopeptide (TPR) repeat protein [Planctomycetota bacterium]|jgi:tetratricopeptide (TPR) repeat protein